MWSHHCLGFTKINNTNKFESLLFINASTSSSYYYYLFVFQAYLIKVMSEYQHALGSRSQD